MFNFFNSPMLKSIRRTFRPPTLITGGDGSPNPFPLPLPGGIPEPDAVFGAESSIPPVAPPPIATLSEPSKSAIQPELNIPPAPLPSPIPSVSLPSVPSAAFLPGADAAQPSLPRSRAVTDKPPIGEAAASIRRGGPTLGVHDFREARDSATAERFQKGQRAFEQEKSLTDTRKDIEGFGDTENNLGTRIRARASFDSVNQNRENLRESVEETRSRAETSDAMQRVTRDEEEVSRINQDADRPRQARFEAHEHAKNLLDDVKTRFPSSPENQRKARANLVAGATKSADEAFRIIEDQQNDVDRIDEELKNLDKKIIQVRKGEFPEENEHSGPPLIGVGPSDKLPKRLKVPAGRFSALADIVSLGTQGLIDTKQKHDRKMKHLFDMGKKQRALIERRELLQRGRKSLEENFQKRKLIKEAFYRLVETPRQRDQDKK